MGADVPNHQRWQLKDRQHAVDVEVFCIDGKARALKSRFGGSEEVGIF